MFLKKMRQGLTVAAMGGIVLGTVSTCDYGPGGGTFFFDRDGGDERYIVDGFRDVHYHDPFYRDEVIIIEDDYYYNDYYYEEEYVIIEEWF